MNHIIHYSCICDIGKRRANNQDNYCCDGRCLADGPAFTGKVHSRDTRLFGVFDGMGGLECGEVASQIAARRAVELEIGRDAASDMLRLCHEANDEICRYVVDHDLQSMGTTAAMLVFAPSQVVLCNIGDSRVYRFSDGELCQISEDHVALAPFGRKPPLLQNLGIPPDELIIEPYVSTHRYRDGDIYLICSDGLTDMVPQDDIRQLIAETEFDLLADALLKKALSNGGVDNITLLICRVEKEPCGWFRRIFKY